MLNWFPLPGFPVTCVNLMYFVVASLYRDPYAPTTFAAATLSGLYMLWIFPYWQDPRELVDQIYFIIASIITMIRMSFIFPAATLFRPIAVHLYVQHIPLLTGFPVPCNMPLLLAFPVISANLVYFTLNKFPGICIYSIFPAFPCPVYPFLSFTCIRSTCDPFSRDISLRWC